MPKLTRLQHARYYTVSQKIPLTKFNKKMFEESDNHYYEFNKNLIGNFVDMGDLGSLRRFI